MNETLERRTWRYAMEPRDYGIAGCKCGNENCEYSEFVDRLWCQRCQIDFEPEHWGLFDGPIGWEICKLLGISFDRIDLERNTHQVAILREGRIDYIDHSHLALPSPQTPEEYANEVYERERDQFE